VYGDTEESLRIYCINFFNIIILFPLSFLIAYSSTAITLYLIACAFWTGITFHGIISKRATSRRVRVYEEAERKAPFQKLQRAM